MKSERLLKILSILETRNLITIRELSERLGVSTRTIRRDMDTLGLMGFPITSKRGLNGGWYLLDNFKTSIKTLSEDELQILTMNPSQQVLTDLESHDKQLAIENKMSKLRSVGSNRYIHIDTENWFEKLEKESFIPIIYQKIKSRNKIIIKYAGRNNHESEYEIEGLGIVLNINEWYLIARKSNETYRTFKVSRVKAVNETGEAYNYPEGFSLKNFWADSKKEFEKTAYSYKVDLVIDKKKIEHIGKYFRITKSINLSDNEMIVTLIFDNVHSAKRTLAGFMDLIIEIKNDELQDIINRHISTL